jgi:isopenicillin-N epimerase
VVRCVEEWLTEHSGLHIVFALFDVITSPTAMVMPYHSLCRLCEARGILTMLDAAHALGQVPLHPTTSGATFLTTNCHKWCFAPKGSALLWSHPSHSSTLQPVVTSWHLRDSFSQRFWQQGTRDDSHYIASAAGLHFYHSLSLPRAQAYNRTLADWATDYLATRWSVQPYPLYSSTSASPFMRVLQLPLTLPTTLDDKDRSQYGNRLLERLMTQHDVVAAFFVYDGKLYLRLSAQVYNTKEDYIRLADVIDQLREQ